MFVQGLLVPTVYRKICKIVDHKVYKSIYILVDQIECRSESDIVVHMMLSCSIITGPCNTNKKYIRYIRKILK